MVTPLSSELQPQIVRIELDGALLDLADAELRAKTSTDSDQCYGYFPYMPSIDQDLPQCSEFAVAHPRITIDSLPLGFNFLRMSLKEQQASARFHLDSDAATALTGNLDTIDQRRVWRLLLNLHPLYTRTLAYIDADPSNLVIARRDNYVYCAPEAIPEEAIKSLDLIPRLDNQVQGVLFCSSQVLHTGQDDEHGHFVGAYGCEV
jgi:hypothetical protein